MRDTQSLGRGRGSVAAGRRGIGFTLIEILIVISIIAVVASLVLVAVNKGRQQASIAMATTDVATLNNALEQYVTDEAAYPGMELPKIREDENYFPKLFSALFGDRKPNGPGGRSAPYTKLTEDKVRVYDEDLDDYVKPTRDQLKNAKIPKYMADPWGNPFFYRPNKGRKSESFMHNTQGADLYSFGPNGEDDTTTESEKSDDIGNW